MGLLIGVGDYGIGDLIAKAQALYDLLNELCGDQLSWENILHKPTTRDGFGLSDVPTEQEVLTLLTGYAVANHTHTWSQIQNKPQLYTKSEVYNKEEIDNMGIGPGISLPIEISDVDGLAAALLNLNFKLVSDIPATPTPHTIYCVLQSGKFLLYVTNSSGVAIALNAVTSTQLATAINTRQPKLTGSNTDVVLADGSFTPFTKESLGLGQVENLPPNLLPISDLVAAALALKANDNEVLKKNGNQTVETGVITFNESPLVPTPEGNGDAANKGYVDQLIGNTSGQSEFEFDLLQEWVVMHNLNGMPVPLITIDNKKVEADIEYLDNDSFKVQFSKPQTGKVTINRF